MYTTKNQETIKFLNIPSLIMFHIDTTLGIEVIILVNR